MTVALCTAKLIEAGYIRQQQRSGVSGLSQIFRTLLYGISLFLGLLTFLAANDFTRLSVVAGGFAAVLAFALRQSLTDVIAGITLGIQRPFLRRDWIMLEDGTVAEIVDMDWRATHLRGWDRAVFILPNARLAQQLVKILPKPGTPFAATYTILVSGEEEPARVKQALKEAVKGCDFDPVAPGPGDPVSRCLERSIQLFALGAFRRIHGELCRERRPVCSDPSYASRCWHAGDSAHSGRALCTVDASTGHLFTV